MTNRNRPRRLTEKKARRSLDPDAVFQEYLDMTEERTAREQLVARDLRFQQALAGALRSGSESIEGALGRVTRRTGQRP
jgi:hypothetical protein